MFLLKLFAVPCELPCCLAPLGGAVSGGGGGWGAAGVLDPLQAAILQSDCVSVQAAETGGSP